MQIEIKSWLFDICTAIEEIETFLLDYNDISLYSKDVKTKRAVERNLTIIGEAMNRILAKHASIELSNTRKIIDTRTRKIIDTRNRIIHGYDTVSDEIIWSIIKH